LSTLEYRMRKVLLQLELTSNGRTASYDSSGNGNPEPDPIPKLGKGDAPHLTLQDRWNQAATDAERMSVLEAAEALLKAIRVSRGDRSRTESEAELRERIVERGEGLPAVDVAVWARTSVKIVHKAREAAGRDRDRGFRPRNGRALAEKERSAEVQRLADDGMSERQIGKALKLHRNTVRRALGRTT